jgi:hypothetical protein
VGCSAAVTLSSARSVSSPNASVTVPCVLLASPSELAASPHTRSVIDSSSGEPGRERGDGRGSASSSATIASASASCTALVVATPVASFSSFFAAALAAASSCASGEAGGALWAEHSALLNLGDAWESGDGGADGGSATSEEHTAMQKRIVTLQRVGISGGRWLTRPFRDARRFPLYTIAARTQMYTHDASVWDLSLVQGAFSVAPRQTPYKPSLVRTMVRARLSSHTAWEACRGLRHSSQEERLGL